MHKGHLGFCAVGITLALGYLVLTGGSAGGFGLLVAALICPLAMIVAMTVLMGGKHGNASEPSRTDAADLDAARVEPPRA
jgi:hypothetical protein